MSDTSFAADLSAALGDTSAPSPEPSSAAPVDTPASPEAATTAPADVAAVSPSTETVPSTPQGPIPVPVHVKALENARTKAVAEAKAKWEQQYGWAKTVDREQVAQAVQIAQRFQQDPGGYIRDLLTEAVGNPQLAPIVRSEVARVLGQRPAATPAPVDLTPLSVEMTDGQARNLYTAEQLQAYVQQELAKVRDEFKPAVQTAQQLRDREELAAQREQANDFAAGALGELDKLPGFKEHAKEIAAAINPKTLRLASDHPAEVTNAAFRAWASLVLPKLSTLERRAVLTDQHATAAASTVNPARAGVAAPKTFEEMSLAEALQSALG